MRILLNCFNQLNTWDFTWIQMKMQYSISSFFPPDYQSLKNGASNTPLEVHVDIEGTSYPISRHNSSGSNNSTEHGGAGTSGSSRTFTSSLRNAANIGEDFSSGQVSEGDVWELKTSANSPVMAARGATAPASTSKTTTTSAMRKSSKSKASSRSGKRSSVKISDRISEAPSPCPDAVSINDSLNSELSAVLADGECHSETSSSCNVEASLPLGEAKLKGDLSSSQSSSHGFQLNAKDSQSSLTEVENDRPGSGMLIRDVCHSSSNSVNVSLNRAITTDLW